MKLREVTPLSDRGPKAATARTAITSLMLGAAALVEIASAHAFFLPHEMMDTTAFYLAWFVLCAMPIVGIMLFWMVHVKPIGYQAAYGTEKHEDYFREMGEKALSQLAQHELDHLREELDTMAAKGSLNAELRVLRRRVAALGAPVAPTETAAAPTGSARTAGTA